MFSLGAALYLMVRALPRVAEEEASSKESFLDRWAHSEIPEKVDRALNSFLLKTLRRIKVIALKFDNAVNSGIRKMSDEEKKQGIDFKDMSEQNNDEKVDK
jgi:hypothetical protein